ncbi:type II secretion system major pseudopilin GspG [Myxococcus sp. AM009]|uniref:type II secretion system major pseudopilin GspG n=1 Tax=unclassified Myxococcus TaxID=2648731 RepID=UPI0015961938|nr:MULTISPECIES: type II secretion system major pseudopilin GspG [unclassified Myxococcus]NVI99224.1 type II secretion system major pseudopilin GspG [Myxococcus sp. AM009]NVJ17392.1 type II secretion system major pseudopilin GspG [Myxococcus sp. AM010]
MRQSQKQQKKQRRNRGMTLIEIMVVITILGLIAAAVGVAVIPQLEAARRDRAALDIKNIQGAMKLYYTKKGKYPDTASGLQALVEVQALEQMPKDPWNNDYVYINEGGKPVIISYGADGASGGEGSDADISSADTATANK